MLWLLIAVLSLPATEVCRDWRTECSQYVRHATSITRQPSKHIALTKAFIGAVEDAMATWHVQDHNLAAEMCLYLATTAWQESNFEFRIGSVGEIGMFQFRLGTVRMVLKIKRSDEYLVRRLLDTRFAAYVFVRHFYELLIRCDNDLYCAWAKYNGTGPQAWLYAEEIMVKFIRVQELNHGPEKAQEGIQAQGPSGSCPIQQESRDSKGSAEEAQKS